MHARSDGTGRRNRLRARWPRSSPGASSRTCRRSPTPRCPTCRSSELLDELLTRVTEILDVDTAAILLIDEDRRTLVARAAKGLEEEVEAVVRVPLGRRLRGPRGRRGPAGPHPRRLHGRHLQPAPAREGPALAARRAADRRGRGHGRAARGQPGRPASSPRRTPTCSSAPPTAPRWRSTPALSERERGLAEELQRSLLPQDAALLPGHARGRALLARRLGPARGRLVRRLRHPHAAGCAWPSATWSAAASAPPR